MNDDTTYNTTQDRKKTQDRTHERRRASGQDGGARRGQTIRDPELAAMLTYYGLNPFPRFNSIWGRWWRWHKENPYMAEWMYQIASAVMARGHKHYSVTPMWQDLRYYRMHVIERERASRGLSPLPPDDYQLNDHYISRYSRFLMWRYPELQGLFRLRKLKAE
jgi:hypothetical protein